MATLKFRSFQCLQDTSESTSDSPYFVIFVGRPGHLPTSSVVTLRNPTWDNTVDTGDIGTMSAANPTVANNVGLNTVVLVALIEEDADPNLTASAVVDPIGQLMKVVFNPLATSGLNAQQIASQILPKFKQLLRVVEGDDDILDIEPLPITTLSGPLSPLMLNGDGGSYKVQFTMMSA